ncbi:hypothetical protein QCM80_34070 [Bradyrhizobium sp. SSUT112]|uniref:hypothetical protein n=1 Tax=Bradyrhizobium sp. SSUT112 TaxID=3040604 RepID=UPI0024490F4F|nr:hypothetical protein [Bradyrhizobium sp. SSUT112]MDH2355662.1 hypothetical protein [Bradyrhizobium sp. SSUT112]
MFVRFVVGGNGENHRWLTGIITEARLLHDRGQLAPYQSAWLAETYAWLNVYLPCPPFSTSNWGPEAVSWFKDTAEPSIKKMWEIAALLEEYGTAVRLLRSKNPGKIVYEDDFQIVVREWKRL